MTAWTVGTLYRRHRRCHARMMMIVMTVVMLVA
jgi:hypothetical protein